MLKEKILRLSPAFALAFMVAASGVSSQAFAWTKSSTLKHVYWILDDKDGDGIGDTEVEKDENGDFYFTFYDEDGKLEYTVKLGDSNPKPDGGSTGLVDYKSLLEEAMKNGGSEITKENHFLESTLGQTIIKHSKTGSIVPVHNPDPGTYMPGDGYGGGTGGGGFDPNNPESIVDQLKKGKKKGNGDDDDGDSGDAASDALKPGYDFSADPALVNPVPSKSTIARFGAQQLPSPTAATNQNRRSGVNTVLGMQPRAAVGNFQAMRGLGGSRRGGSHR